MILVVGELLMDMVTTDLVKNLSETKLLQIKIGGSAANFASFCSTLGAPVKLIAAVGKDGFGDIAVQTISNSGIATDHIARLPNNFTSVIVVGKSHSTPEFIPYRDADHLINAIDEQLISNCSVLHSTAFALSKEPARTSIMQAFEKAHQLKKLISVDWNFAKKIWGTDNNATAVFDQLMSYRPLLKVSMDDARRFWNIGDDVDAAKQKLDAYQTTFICLTHGANGVFYKRTDAPWEYKPNLPTKVIDVTGAGDAFWSGFITSYIQNAQTTAAIDNALIVARERLEQRI